MTSCPFFFNFDRAFILKVIFFSVPQNSNNTITHLRDRNFDIIEISANISK